MIFVLEALEVREGDLVVPVINRIQPAFDLVIATKDWHPANHRSFASTNSRQIGESIEINGEPQVMWPDHCIQNTHGAEFHPDLNTNSIQKIFYKGIDAEIDSYSGFFDNGYKRSSGMKDYLIQNGVQEIHIVGLALDYCVKYTALDGKALGLDVTVITDGTKAVALKESDIEDSKEELL